MKDQTLHSAKYYCRPTLQTTVQANQKIENEVDTYYSSAF